MRISIPSIFQGSLGTLVQRAIAGINALAVTPWPFSAGTVNVSTSLLAAAGNEQIVAPAANTSGIIVWSAHISTQASPGYTCKALIAKASAPITWSGVPLLAALSGVASSAGLLGVNARLEQPVFVAAGLGLYWVNTGDVAEDRARCSVQYTVL